MELKNQDGETIIQEKHIPAFLENEYKYIKIVDISSKFPKKITKTFQVISKSSDDLLGYILWEGGWRQYVFKTITDYPCIFSRGCNLDINNFIDNLMGDKK